MPILEDSIRPFWIPGLNEISGRVVKGLGGWICDEDFQVYSGVEASSFKLSVVDTHALLSALAADVSRLATASLESAISITRVERLPRSTAWTVIQMYYSAFFAAHSILRLMGVSVSRLDGAQINSVNKIANVFGAVSHPTTRGHYCCTFDPSKNELNCVKLDANSGGFHEAFWSVFKARLRTLAEDVLMSKVGTVANNQMAASKLSDLEDNLCKAPGIGGNWLSLMRNQVNYSHRWGVWFPYEGYQNTHHDRLHEDLAIWMGDPLRIELSSYADRDLLCFRQTCNFLVALCRATVVDMSRRCSAGTSFHKYGPLAILHLIQQRPRVQLRS